MQFLNKAVWCAVSMIRSKPDASLDTIPEDDRTRPGPCQPGMLAEQAYIHLPAVRALTQGAWLSRRRYICQQYGFDPAAQSHSSSTIALVSFSRKQFANIGCFGAALKLGLALVGCLRGGRWRVRGGRWLVPVAILWLLGRQASILDCKALILDGLFRWIGGFLERNAQNRCSVLNCKP